MASAIKAGSLNFIVLVLLLSLLFGALVSCNREKEPLGNIYGAVTDAESGSPIGGVIVSLSPGNAEVATSEGGLFFFDNIKNGSYSLHFEKSGFESEDIDNIIIDNGYTENLKVQMFRSLPKIEIAPLSVSIPYQTNAEFSVTNSGRGFLEWSATCASSWISLSKTSGSLSKGESVQITVDVNYAELDSGTHNSVIVIQSNAGNATIPISTDVPELPSVSIYTPTAVSYNSALLHGALLSLGAGTILDYGFCYGKSENPSVDDNIVSLGEKGKTGPFSAQINALESETKYYVRSFVKSEYGIVYSEGTESFFTSLSDVVLITQKVSLVAFNEANVEVIVENAGGHSITEAGICWSTGSTPSLNENHKKIEGNIIVNQPYNISISGLLEGTNYTVRSYALTSKNLLFYGNVLSFMTGVEPKLATVNAVEVSQVLATSLFVSSSISNNGNAEIHETGFCWSMTPNASINDSRIKAESSNSSFNAKIEGLQSGTKYYVRAYVINSVGVSYSEEISITTLTITVPQLSRVIVDNITTTGASLRGSITSDGNSTVLDAGFCWSESPNPSISDSFVSLGGNNVSLFTTLTGLKDGQNYYVRAYAKNSAGTGYGEVLKFSTITINPPVINSITLEYVGSTMAIVECSILSDGNADIIEQGFVWSTVGCPTTSDNVFLCELKDSFKHILQGLPYNQTIYLRAFASNGKHIGYSSPISFITNGRDKDIWDGSTAASFSGGSGTEEDPIIIKTCDQFKLFQERSAAGNNFEGVYFRVVTDLDMSNIKLPSFGNFYGCLNGDDHIISNLNCGTLFSSNHGCIKNFTFKGISTGGIVLSHYGSLERIKTYLNITSASDVGAIAQVIYKDATITNSSNYGDVKSSNGCAGGIVGYAAYEAEISNCYNFGTINGTDAGGVVGAFVNSLSSVSIIHLENCINYGRIIATNRAGGLVGRFLFRYHAGVSPAWTTTLCKECGNRGEVEGNYAGGIVGYLENSMENPSFVFDITTMTYDVYLTDCYNLAQITSAQSPGGIIGLIKLSYNAYQTTKVFKAIPGVTLNRCINSADYGLVYNVINSNCYSGSQEKYTINNRRFDYSSSYWLFDIINNRGREYAIGTDTSTNSNWFAQNSHSCTTSSGFDLVSLLGEKWKYASINGRATPVLLFEEE